MHWPLRGEEWMEVDGWVEARKTMRVPSPQAPNKTRTRARVSLTLVAELSYGRGAEAAQIITKAQRCAGFCLGYIGA